MSFQTYNNLFDCILILFIHLGEKFSIDFTELESGIIYYII